MIIPTADFDPMFAEDGVPFRCKMIAYIRREFGTMLGPRVELLERDDGLDLLARLALGTCNKTSQSDTRNSRRRAA